jgi:hypothetical protein
MDKQDIQKSFTDWLASTGGYLEEVSDPNGSAGALCHSLGMMKDKPILIEFKYSITPDMPPISLPFSS